MPKQDVATDTSAISDRPIGLSAIDSAMIRTWSAASVRCPLIYFEVAMSDLITDPTN